MSWTKVLAEDALSTGTREVVKVGDRSILLLNQDGTIYAVNSKCPHLKLSLKNGKITSDGEIVCPWHKSSFNLTTGAAKDWTPWPPVVGQVMAMVSSAKPLEIFPVKIEEGSIWVEA
jgi:nitrite reductase/ring-hydroxylating ferredoxin subunit